MIEQNMRYNHIERMIDKDMVKSQINMQYRCEYAILTRKSLVKATVVSDRCEVHFTFYGNPKKCVIFGQ